MIKLSPIENSIMRVLRSKKKPMTMPEVVRKIQYAKKTDLKKSWYPIFKRLVSFGYIECQKSKYGVVSEDMKMLEE